MKKDILKKACKNSNKGLFCVIYFSKWYYIQSCFTIVSCGVFDDGKILNIQLKDSLKHYSEKLYHYFIISDIIEGSRTRMWNIKIISIERDTVAGNTAEYTCMCTDKCIDFKNRVLLYIIYFFTIFVYMIKYFWN